ncbi:MAG TPA: glycosyltransferase family 4 protein, partial [Opitutaceae bacterium]|nr:glycosyltransferase family 4 protein [Opitutaceae bacterium]
ALEFAARGHEVTIFSRRWPGFANEELISGVRHVRLPGRTHTLQLWRNLLRDFFWSQRLSRLLPPADIAIVNCVALPLWLGRFRPDAGRVVLHAGRMPKGQFRFYRRIARVLAPSTAVQKKIAAENPRLARVTRTVGNPIAWRELEKAPASGLPAVSLTVGYVGRLHREKGLDLLVAALSLLAGKKNLPPWRVLLCGPADVARGGSGPAYAEGLTRRLTEILSTGNCTILPPTFDETALKKVYQDIDIFCYPSLAEQGETFGVAVAEAMAAGAVPIVSRLACFTDFVADGENGLVFNHAAGDAPACLAAALEQLLIDRERRIRLAGAARRASARFDFSSFADGLLADFTGLTAADA